MATLAAAACGIYKGEQAINVASVGIAGLNPNVSAALFQHYQNQDPSADRARYLLELYQKSVQATWAVQEAKVGNLKTARKSMFCGFIFTILRLALLFSANLA